MIKIYGSPMSSGGRCFWMLEEIGVAYEKIEPNLRDPEQRARYVADVFAGGKIPFLVDGEVRDVTLLAKKRMPVAGDQYGASPNACKLNRLGREDFLLGGAILIGGSR